MNNQESLLTNKNFTRSVTVFVAVLAIFFFVKLIHVLNPSNLGGEMMNTISVGGEGEVSAIPDIAVIDVSISKEAKTAKEATDSLNESIKSTLSYLSEKEIEAKDIKSEYGGIYPKYETQAVYCVTYPCSKAKTTIVGYTATQNINIKIRVADNANEIRSGLVDLGLTNITGPNFSVDDEELLQEEARAKAILNAQQKAEKLAKNLNVKLGKVVGFYEEGNEVFPMAYNKSSMAFGGDMEIMREEAPSLPKGENKISSKVNITYRIK